MSIYAPTGKYETPLCRRCGKNPVEVGDDDWESEQCERCNDRDIERHRERVDWDYYHPKD